MNKTKAINIVLDPSSHEAIKNFCESNCMTISKFIRKTTLDKIYEINSKKYGADM
ncbi:MAG: hypothetical protein ACTSXD_06875 [Candidatus Heimdallarchaeaceae archaeon]